ncbi:MAG: signal peptidase I [Elusimicrobiaceae bacterium]|nr:signal peptidase I [Elusimicrobiaceae bacterium]
MEQTLFITGIFAFIFAKLSIYLNKKNKLENKNIFKIWAFGGIILAGILAYYIFNFMATNGVSGGLSLKHTLFILAIILGLIWWASKEIKKDYKKVYLTILDWAETIYFAAFFAAVVMFFFIQAFKIPSGSMRNTLLEGDNLFVNKIVYGFRLPFMKDKLVEFKPIERGDIIIFKFPATSKQQINCGESQYGRDFVKRVIGLPGDKVELRNKQLYINDKLMPPQDYEVYDTHLREEYFINIPKEDYQKMWENRTLEHTLGLYLRDYFGPVIVPQGQYLAMGDNRDFSCDSRFWGPVPKENIKGKAWFLHWPLNRMRFIK